jgi:hypothetical protein
MATLGAADIVTQGAAAAGFAKVLVDLIKLSPVPSPSIVLPIFAFICSEGCAFLLFLANGGAFTSQSIAICALVGIAATAGAIGMTAAQNKANE